jgi:hypothetical protein
VSKSRTPKNRSARTRKRARQEAARAARTVQPPGGAAGPEGSALWLMRPPYSGYESWITLTPSNSVPEGAQEGLDGELADSYGTVRRLAPLYEYSVPMAALTLERLIRRGLLPLATPGTADLVSLVPLADLVAICAADEILAAAPEGLDALLHELHAHGALVVDDDHVIRLAALV